MGYEGRIAKSYFYCLNLIVPDNFHFVGRSRRPAKDAFNSLLNLGYHFLYSFMVGMIKKFGLSQGFGMIHESHQHHATLASDLMEEWRAIIVDDTILTLLKNGWITEDDFSLGDEESYLTQEAQKIFLQALASRILEIHAYSKEDTKRYTCLYMLEMQIESFIRACKEGDASLYQEGFTGDVDGKLL